MIKCLYLFVCLCIMEINANAQVNHNFIVKYSDAGMHYVIDDSTQTVIELDRKPEFKGGEVALQRYLVESVRYPKEAFEAKAQGRVFVSFIVAPNGKVKKVKGKGEKDHTHWALVKEAERVVYSMPRWLPGVYQGKAVSVKYVIPVNFVL